MKKTLPYLFLIKLLLYSSIFFVACNHKEVQNQASLPVTDSSNKVEPPFKVTLISNSKDIYVVLGDTVRTGRGRGYGGAGDKALFVELYKNGEFLFSGSQWPCDRCVTSLDDFESYPCIMNNGKAYDIFVLADEKLIIVSHFEYFLYYKNTFGYWMPFTIDIYPKYISRFTHIEVFPEKKKLAFVGENTDLAGNHYKGDSLVISYKNDVFEIDQYYPKSKHLGITYQE